MLANLKGLFERKKSNPADLDAPLLGIVSGGNTGGDEEEMRNQVPPSGITLATIPVREGGANTVGIGVLQKVDDCADCPDCRIRKEIKESIFKRIEEAPAETAKLLADAKRILDEAIKEAERRKITLSQESRVIKEMLEAKLRAEEEKQSAAKASEGAVPEAKRGIVVPPKRGNWTGSTNTDATRLL